jgi:hypothetical protein
MLLKWNTFYKESKKPRTIGTVSWLPYGCDFGYRFAALRLCVEISLWRAFCFGKRAVHRLTRRHASLA